MSDRMSDIQSWRLVPAREHEDICNACGGELSFAVLVSTWQDMIPEWWCGRCVSRVLAEMGGRDE